MASSSYESTQVSYPITAEEVGEIVASTDLCNNLVVAWNSALGLSVARVLADGSTDWTRRYTAGDGAPSGRLSGLETDREGSLYLTTGAGALALTATGEPHPNHPRPPFEGLFLDEVEGDHFVGLPGYAEVALDHGRIVWGSADFAVSTAAVQQHTVDGAALSPNSFLRLDLSGPAAWMDDLGDSWVPSMESSTLELWREAPYFDEEAREVRERELTFALEFDGQLAGHRLASQSEEYALLLSQVVGGEDEPTCDSRIEWISASLDFSLDGCWLVQNGVYDEFGSLWALWLGGAQGQQEPRVMRWLFSELEPEELPVSIPPLASPRDLPALRGARIGTLVRDEYGVLIVAFAKDLSEIVVERMSN